MEPTCPKCGGSAFAATPKAVKNWNDKVTFFHCAACGTIVGSTYMETQDMYNALTADVLPPRTKQTRS